jgi:heptosyltransferase-2
MNILIIRFSSIGDIILTSAFIRQVRKTFPEAQIDYVIKKTFAQLIQHNPHINHIYTYDSTTKLSGLKELRSTLKTNGYDFIFDLQNNFRSNFILRAFAHSQKGQIDKLKIKRALLVYLKINRYGKILPVPLRYLKTAESAQVMDAGLGLELFLGDNINPPQIEGEYIAIAPGAAHFTKRWPMEKFESLIKKILKQFAHKIVLLGGKEDADAFSSLEISDKIINFTGRLSLLESAAVIKNAVALISNDSALMHTATAVNTPVLAIFGSTSQELGFFPFRGKSMVMQNNNLWCRPCTHIGRKHCPLGHFKCMEEITADDVFNGLQKLIADKV